MRVTLEGPEIAEVTRILNEATHPENLPTLLPRVLDRIQEHHFNLVRFPAIAEHINETLKRSST